MGSKCPLNRAKVDVVVVAVCISTNSCSCR